MKRVIRRKTVLCAITLLLAASLAAQKKKTAVKTQYDKFKDITCASADLGDLASFRI